MVNNEGFNELFGTCMLRLRRDAKDLRVRNSLGAGNFQKEH